MSKQSCHTRYSADGGETWETVPVPESPQVAPETQIAATGPSLADMSQGYFLAEAEVPWAEWAKGCGTDSSRCAAPMQGRAKECKAAGDCNRERCSGCWSRRRGTARRVALFLPSQERKRMNTLELWMGLKAEFTPLTPGQAKKLVHRFWGCTPLTDSDKEALAFAALPEAEQKETPFGKRMGLQRGYSYLLQRRTWALGQLETLEFE